MGKLSVLSEEGEFSVLQFEKTLTNLKDSQDCINQCCQWCLANRQHYKKIVNSWLNVIKRVKVEQRLTLFYLANDVVQYSKRKNYEFVDIWGTAIQKATTMVRDDKVKHKILRIFKIWEQRGVYGEEFITDLCGLISVQPAGSKNDEPHEFQSSYVINKIKYCASLENDTDAKLKILKEHNPKIQITEGLVNSLKDRAHVDDVEKELDVYVEHTEKYISALQIEIKNRIALISVLKQAETQLECDRKDVKTVANAYKNFGIHMSHVKKKLAEKLPTLTSPVPSPDINAPSPSPEDGIDLPDDDLMNSTTKSAVIQFPSQAFYVPPSSANYNTNYNSTTFPSNNSTAGADASFISNGFSSFMGQNLGFDISNIGASGLFSNSTSEDVRSISLPIGDTVPVSADLNNPAPYNPLLPPPQPPFSKNSDSGFNFNASMDMNPNYSGYSYGNAYNTQAIETWDNNAENPTWNEEKAGVKASRSPEDDSLSDTGGHDVDHRNLISLTGSPNEDSSVNGRDERKSAHKRGNFQSITPQDRNWNSGDQDYRSFGATSGNKGKSRNSSSTAASHQDRDYRIQFNLRAPTPPPPPPPPPPSKLKKRTHSSTKSPRKYEDDFSPDSNEYNTGKDTHLSSLEPPPPLPDLLDDVDANQFLDEITNEIGDFSNLSAEMVNNDVAENDGDSKIHANNGKNSKIWRPLQPPPMAFNLGNPNNLAMGYPEGNFMLRNPLLPPTPSSGGLLPTPKIDPNYSANWMDDGQSAALWSEENPFNNIDESSNNYERGGFNNFRGNSHHSGGGFRNRGNNNRSNTRGSWPERGRGRGDRKNGRGKGNNNGHYRPRGSYKNCKRRVLS